MFYKNIIYEIRIFDFRNYPTYVSNMRQFRWKPLVIADLLTSVPSVVWLDASAVIHKPLELLYTNTKQFSLCFYYPWMLLSLSGHGVFAATDRRMYDYFPLSTTVAKTLHMWEASAQLIFATNQVRTEVLRYVVLCALEEQCMAPIGSTTDCKFKNNRFMDYAECHRQDQSAINMILACVNNYNDTKYFRTSNDIISIEKTKTL